ncbi:MAG: nitroreductase family protein [Tissierellales bacterium]|nr:nitroreductase family protein [Tissierellales bacterium]MBN2827064.1 nitroreductase family protein [Tissierellales bacterium]
MDFKELAESRRSIQFFDKDAELSDALLEKIINLAVLAPSAYNFQPWRIIAVKSNESKEKLFPLASNQDKILKASVTLIIVGNREGYGASNPIWQDIRTRLGDEKTSKIMSANQQLYGETEEKRIKFAELNAGLLAMSIMYASKYYGIDSHPVGGIDAEGIERAFNITGADKVVMLICLGKFDQAKNLNPRKPRKTFFDITEII